MSDQAGLTLRGVHASYDDASALRGIDLTVGRDELLVVLGPSGAGKSTLLRVIAGLHPATAGTVVIAGRDVTRLRPGRRNVSMVFQSYALFPHLTVAENIAFGLIVRDTPKSLAMQRAQEAAAAAGCGHLLARRPGQLSGGERQRVALARAIVREPDIFLLDEPLSNLDLETRVETRAELKALHARVGGTMVHVTHDQTEALVLGDRIAVMRDGLLEQVGTPDEIWRLPATTFVARFVGSPAMNLLPADGPLRPVDTPPDVELTAARQIGFRPESVVLGHGDAAILLGHGDRTPGVVERVDVVGEDAYAYVRVAGLAVVARVPAIARPRQGDEVRMAIRWRDAHLFEASTGRRLASP